MSSTMGMWIEVVFNTGYLVVIWTLTVKMFKRIDNVKPKDIAVARSMMIAFVLLAIGDTGHVGFRTLSLFLQLLNPKLVGMGALATAVTVTLFYILMLDAWRKRFNSKYGAFEYTLIVIAIVRLIMFIHPGNQWSSPVPPFEWSIMRNIPLILQGLGAAYLILRDAFRQKDTIFKFIGIMILLSYSCYLPVIFLIQQKPWVGMLMIPKTLAYVAIAGIAYKEFFSKNINTSIYISKPSKNI